jgi:hypothetical protein
MQFHNIIRFKNVKYCEPIERLKINFCISYHIHIVKEDNDHPTLASTIIGHMAPLTF